MAGCERMSIDYVSPVLSFFRKDPLISAHSELLLIQLQHCFSQLS